MCMIHSCGSGEHSQGCTSAVTPQRLKRFSSVRLRSSYFVNVGVSEIQEIHVVLDSNTGDRMGMAARKTGNMYSVFLADVCNTISMHFQL